MSPNGSDSLECPCLVGMNAHLKLQLNPSTFEAFSEILALTASYVQERVNLPYFCPNGPKIFERSSFTWTGKCTKFGSIPSLGVKFWKFYASSPTACEPPF